MSFFDHIYQKLFSERDNTPKILFHERIQRKERYLKQYSEWRESTQHFDLLRAIASSYEAKQRGDFGTPNVYVLTTTSADGFAISYDASIPSRSFQFLFDWFGEKVIDLGYLLYNSDVTMVEKGSSVESKEKHYLKPSPELESNKQTLHYGNILIEHILTDDHPTYIRLMASTYPDREHQKPDNFGQLLDYLLAF